MTQAAWLDTACSTAELTSTLHVEKQEGWAWLRQL
jgi:hypothetical protein